MAGRLSGWAEPDEPDQPQGEVEVAVTIPEVFAGVSLQELTVRGGRITGMEASAESVTINATLPTSHYNALVEAVILDTDGRGRVRLAES
jgi:translation elongation factor EF-G